MQLAVIVSIKSQSPYPIRANLSIPYIAELVSFPFSNAVVGDFLI